jgi:hypothetical protein
MKTPPDLEALARRYVELWQDQVAATAADPEITAALTRLVQAAAAGLGAQASWWQTLWPQPPSGEPHVPTGPVAVPEAPGSSPAAAASVDSGGNVAELQARLAALEERLAALETRSRKPRGSAQTRSRRDRAS